MPARRLGILFGLLAAGVAGYLAFTAWQTRGTPWGCGAGSGCEEVLRSRWSSLFGLPVSVLAVIVDLGLVWSLLRQVARPAAGRIAVALSASIIVAALWFISLQAFVLKAYCPWCLVDHALGLTAAACAILSVRRLATPVVAASTRRSTDDDLFDDRITPLRTSPSIDPFGESLVSHATTSRDRSPQGLWKAVTAGASLALLLIILQVSFGKAPASIARLPQDANADTGPGANRAIAVLQGRLPINVHEVPVLGSPEARLLVVVMFDYCCPHCRDTHEALREAISSGDPQSLGVILLPTPLNADCNPAMEETEPRFIDSCELARLALAVWRVEPERFSDFDAWLFAPELPRTAAEARTEAARLVGDARLSQALADPWVDERIAANVTAYRDSEAKVLPILLSPGASAIVGRTDDRNELFQLLEHDFGWNGGAVNAP